MKIKWEREKKKRKGYWCQTRKSLATHGDQK